MTVSYSQGKIEDAVLKTIAGIGLISLSILAPNVLSLLKYSPLSKNKSRQKRSYIKNRVLTKLKEKGYVSFKKENGEIFARLTKKGDSIIRKMELGRIKIKKQKKWDNKWRVIMFDIKENRRKTRDQFRIYLQGLDFRQIQKSVWVCPYPCESVIKLLKADLAIGKDILYMTVESIENDYWIKKEFNLD